MELNKDLLLSLESLLNQYDKVFLADLSGQGMRARWERFLSEEDFPTFGNRTLLLSAEDINISGNCGFSYKKIAKGTLNELKNLYFMYEFSDRFRLISNENNFGVIWNYVDAGLLTEKEAFQAILGERK